MINDHTFLYVEDDPLGREAMELALKQIMGVQRLYIFEDSTEFLSRVKSLPHKPDVFLLDIHVRPYSGFEMLAMLRLEPDYQDARIIAFTASVMNEEAELLKDSGFNGVIGKPIRLTVMPALIERIINGETVWHISDDF
jgi:CheY-like chemotaxis protein